MSEKSCKLCDLYGICGAHTAGCVKDPDEGCPFYRYFKKIFQPRWIPVSERLPEINNYGHGPVWKHEVLITGYLSFDDEKTFIITTAFAEDVRNKCVPDMNVIAWMPWPEPYRESGDKE